MLGSTTLHLISQTPLHPHQRRGWGCDRRGRTAQSSRQLSPGPNVLTTLLLHWTQSQAGPRGRGRWSRGVGVPCPGCWGERCCSSKPDRGTWTVCLGTSGFISYVSRLAQPRRRASPGPSPCLLTPRWALGLQTPVHHSPAERFQLCDVLETSVLFCPQVRNGLPSSNSVQGHGTGQSPGSPKQPLRFQTPFLFCDADRA